MRIHYASLKRLSALRIDKTRRACARFETELILHTDIAQHGHEIIHRLKIELTGFLLDLIPRDVKTDASQLMISADAIGEKPLFAAIFGYFLRDPQTRPERRPRRRGARNCSGDRDQEKR